MSSGDKRPLATMQEKARWILNAMSYTCERIELAGSVRRQELLVGDIEIVAVPRFYIDLYGQTTSESAVDRWIASEAAADSIQLLKNGKKQKAFRVFDAKVDLFLQPDPETWGINFLLRTGPAEFSRWMVTKRSKGGACPDKYQFRDARLWHGDQALETPEEADVFRWFDMDFIDPTDRAEAVKWGKYRGAR